MAKKSPEINGGSMSDISFLLLTFFLLTSSIDTDFGIFRQLPRPVVAGQNPAKIKPRNIFVVKVNKDDRLLFDGEIGSIEKLKDRAKDFLGNPNNLPNLPEKEKTAIPLMGDVDVSKGVISLQNDRGTSYDMYVQVQNELAKAVNEMRNECARQYFGKSYADLTEEQRQSVNQAVPGAISEAEPKNVGGK